MFNFAVFALGLLSGFPKPDLVSVDIGSIQAGGGVGFSWEGYDSWVMLPHFGLSIGQARVYWGKKIGFVSGLELFRIDMEVVPIGFYNPTSWSTSEFLIPQVGLSCPLGPTRQRSKGCFEPVFYSENYVPRLDVICGFSFLYPNLSSSDNNIVFILPTIRTEAKLLIFRTVQLIFENRNLFSKDYLGLPELATIVSLSLNFTLGYDYIIKKGEESEQKSE